MDAIEAIKARRSIRKFKPDVFPKETLMEIFETAQRSPSYKNCQPWEVSVVSGAKKEALTEILEDLIQNDIPIRPDIPEPVLWPSAIAERMKASVARRAKELGSAPVAGNTDLLKKSKMANAQFYGAPYGMFLYQDGSLPEWSLVDMGMFAQTLMIAATAHGVGTVPQAYLTDYSPDVKKFLGLPDGKRLVLGMSIGIPDLSSKAATFFSDRIPLSEMVKWVE
jgi:nitroreductase